MVEALIPIRHPNKDFFVLDIFDCLPGFRDDRASMEHPIFSLSTKPDLRTLEYEHNGNTIKIIPSTLGLATIHDKDILLYVVSYLRAAMRDGHEINQRVRFTAHDLLVSTNRATGGIEYKRLEDGLNRLRGTTINTNIATNGIRMREGFGLIESWKVIEKSPDNGRMIALEIKLSDWFYNSVIADELLSINRNYFRLRKPVERRLYEVGRKHCGDQERFAIGLSKLKKKIGSTSTDRKFRFMVRKIVDTDHKDKHFPDYSLHLHSDNLLFKLRRYSVTIPAFKPWVYEKAKSVAPGLDVYALETEWREWAADKEKPSKGYPAAFIGFCKQKERL